MYRLRGLGASGSVSDLLAAAAARYGLSPTLLYSVAQHESALNPSAVSPAGARGVMQLMPATAASLGVTDPLDAAQNIDGGARYLSQLMTRYGGDTSLALAAYNAGPGNVSKYGGIPPFPETQSYVASIMGDIGGQNVSDSASFPLVGSAGSDSFGSGDGLPSDLSTGALLALALAGIGIIWAVAS